MHIAVAGNIGSGKTTLTGLIAKHYKYQPQFEDVDTNPYLQSFYKDMKRWSFNLQIYFLNSRFRQIVEIHDKKTNVIQDRTIYEDARIFAPNLHDMGLMSSRDFNTYKSIFDLMVSFIKPPDLLIYLKADVPTLVSQIQKRGREYENSIRLDYLKSLNERYEKWIDSYDSGKLLVINMENIHFHDNKKDLSLVIEKIDAELFGLF